MDGLFSDYADEDGFDAGFVDVKRNLNEFSYKSDGMSGDDEAGEKKDDDRPVVSTLSGRDGGGNNRG